MSRTLILCAAILGFAAVASPSLAQKKRVVITVEQPSTVDVIQPRSPGHRPAVDVAILLDTSNSMDGLINQAKSQLWTIVQQFAKAKRDGQTPVLRVALFEYGNTRLPASEGYIRQVVPLTDDLDKLSESLFGLSTSGGDEYCGQVIGEAVTRLDWSKEPHSYKAIFIAGNEPFTQGSVDYRAACKRAIERGIVVNTIHCGNSSEGINGKWQDGARLAEGEFFNIDQDRAVVHITCPQDAVIIKLSEELNKTYLWYGKESDRKGYARNQVAQDNNAQATSAPVAADRAAVKASKAYDNRRRDLVDAVKEDSEALKKVPASELPDELRNESLEKREVIVKESLAKRGELQKQINKLNAERAEYLARESKRMAGADGKDTFGAAAKSTIQKQLEKSGFETVTQGE